LATEAWLDGCLGEGAAAAQAQYALRCAADEGVRSTLAVIARDEASHAELAWAVLAFCLQEGGSPVCEAIAALLRSRDQEREFIGSSAGSRPADGAASDLARLRSFGRISSNDIQAIRHSTAFHACSRAERLLFVWDRQRLAKAVSYQNFLLS
jgi:hypothetical protein